jgi:hypothetical protein
MTIDDDKSHDDTNGSSSITTDTISNIDKPVESINVN